MENRIAINLALQIVFEYPDWGEEHVSDMLSLFETEPCTFEELRLLCSLVQRLKDQGMDYTEIIKELNDTVTNVE